MTTEQLRHAQSARPFRPFRLRTGSGREYLVPHPEFLWIIPPGRTIGVAHPDGGAEIIDLLLFESLHFENGRRRGSTRRRA